MIRIFQIIREEVIPLDDHSLDDVNMSETAYRASRAHKVLGSPLRYRMYMLIGDREEVRTGTLADILNRNVESISYHVGQLKDLDLIYSEKRGREQFHKIKREDLYDILRDFEGLFDRE